MLVVRIFDLPSDQSFRPNAVCFESALNIFNCQPAFATIRIINLYFLARFGGIGPS